MLSLSVFLFLVELKRDYPGLDDQNDLASEGKPVPEPHNGKEVRTVLYLPHEEGQGLVEYALILVLVAIVVIAILVIMGPQIGNIFSQITNGLGGT